jgi:CheY-like chemotaxis protein
MSSAHLNLLLCDDDLDDCYFFKEAIDGLSQSANFTAVHNGDQLMQLLINETNELPHVLFLDFNMPRKNGFECLIEIKGNKKLDKLPVIIFTTSLDQEAVNQLYKNGAHYFIHKPAEFKQIQKLVQNALTLITQESNLQPSRENFVLKEQSS